MTEADARKKMCPLLAIGVSFTSGILTERKHVIDAAQRCFGSECMYWRWEQVEIMAPDGQGWADEEPQMEPSKVHGYCGLAGKP